jgi:AcrR family transcriptional regulator
MTSGPLRERKKEATRASISGIATLLFVQRGFDRVTIGEVAAAAQVSKMTVTNYFPRKEDLVFDRRDVVVGGPADAVRHRPAGQSVTEAVRGWFRAGLAAGDPTLGPHGVAFDRLVTGSATLLAAEREMWEQREVRLAQAMAADTSPAADRSVVPVLVRVRAAALSGVLRSVHDEGRRLMLAGSTETAAARTLAPLAEQAFDAVQPLVG